MKIRGFFRRLGLSAQVLLQSLPRITGLVVLNLILLATVFHWKHAELTNQSVSLALMVLLLALFADLKDFDFWGLKGTRREQAKIEQALEQSKEKPSINITLTKKIGNRSAITQLEQKMAAQPTYLMGDLKANFLQVAFDIERLLRLSGARLTGQEIDPSTPAHQITDVLVKAQLLTESGKDQLEAIRGIRNLLIHGRDEEINDYLLQTGWELATQMRSDLYNWLYGPTK